jgi:hypothetical protein
MLAPATVLDSANAVQEEAVVLLTSRWPVQVVQGVSLVAEAVVGEPRSQPEQQGPAGQAVAALSSS